MFRSLSGLSIVLLSLMVGTARAEPPGGSRAGHHDSRDGGRHGPVSCITPWGVDFCALTGRDVTLALPPEMGGSPVAAGSSWTIATAWGTNARGGLPGLPLSYRPGYQTAFPDDPMQDFVSKVEKFTVVIDPGTHRERRFVFREPMERALLTTIGDYWGAGGLTGTGIDADGQWITFVPTFAPLSVGDHEIHFIYTLSAESCDGFPSFDGEPLTFEGGHCLPAGDFAIFPDWHPYTITFALR